MYNMYCLWKLLTFYVVLDFYRNHVLNISNFQGKMFNLSLCFWIVKHETIKSFQMHMKQQTGGTGGCSTIKSILLSRFSLFSTIFAKFTSHKFIKRPRIFAETPDTKLCDCYRKYTLFSWRSRALINTGMNKKRKENRNRELNNPWIHV